jgi:hypothetical protein
MPHFLVDYSFDPPLTEPALKGAFDALKPCLESRNIRRLRSWLADDRTRMVCEYEAADTQSVRDAYRSANVPYVRVWSAQLFEFGPPTVKP